MDAIEMGTAPACDATTHLTLESRIFAEDGGGAEYILGR